MLSGQTAENIVFNLVNIESTNEVNSYKIEITNETGFDLTHLILDLSYPIKMKNGSKDNPYTVEGEAENATRPVNLKSGESMNFSVIAPINEVFSDTDLLDFENPIIELQGYSEEGNSEIPFEIGGSLDALVGDY